MVKVRKRASKRVSTKQKAKITKKVKEHTRKSKRNAKKDPTWKSKKKVDPGIPNSYPYKEQLLNEIEKKRMQAEQAKREAREAHINSNGATADIDEEGMDRDDDAALSPEASSSANTPAAPRQLRGTLSEFYSSLVDKESDPLVLATVVLLDARDPLSWRVSALEEKVQSSSCNLVIALTKVDLVPLEVVATWMAYLSATVKCPVFPICSPQHAKNGIKARAAGGIAKLAKHLENLHSARRKAESDKREDAVAIVGIENSGKTSLANVLAPMLEDLNIIDTPPIVAASSRQAHLSEQEQQEEDDDEVEDEDDDMIRARDKQAAHRILIRNSGFIFKVREPLPLVNALMERVLQVSDLMMAFNVPAFSTTDDFLIAVARTQGRLKKGAVPDRIAAARHVLRGWSTGEVGYYSKPPKDVEGIEEERLALANDDSFKGLLLSRKEWRTTWKGRELRLTTGSDGLLDNVKVAFAKSADVDDEEIEEDIEEGDVDFDDEDEDEEEEEEEEEEDDDDEE